MMTMLKKWTYKRLSIQIHKTPGTHKGIASGLLYVPSVFVLSLVMWRIELVVLFNAGKKVVAGAPSEGDRSKIRTV